MDNDTKSPKQDVRFLVFSDDWGRHPSSCQHIIGELLDRYHVTWVNTIGMRPPTFDISTIKRILGKMKSWLPGAKIQKTPDKSQNQPLPEIINPIMWPWFKRKFDRWLNQFLLSRQLRKHSDESTIVVTSIPVTCDLIDHIPARKWVYYCVDDFSEWPGLDQRTMKIMEEELVQRADLIIAASRKLQERLLSLGRESVLMTHGVDLTVWSKDRNISAPPNLSNFEKPLCIFWGVVDRRLDYEFLEKLNESLGSGTILLIGPSQSPDPKISSLSKVKMLPPVPFEALPEYGGIADVLIMPYIDAPVTQAMQPLKLLEYLATGKPVVVRDLPATNCFSDMMLKASHPDEFSKQVNLALSEGIPDSQLESRKRLCEESWHSKSEFFVKTVTEESQP